MIQRKICILGSFSVGKTSLIRQFVEGKFDDRYLSTIGVKVSRKILNTDPTSTLLLVWDLAGGEESLLQNTAYLRGTMGALIVCDITRPKTAETAEEYAKLVRQISPDASILFLANKADLPDPAIDMAEFSLLAEKYTSAPVYLTSAKTGLNVETAFAEITQLMEKE